MVGTYSLRHHARVCILIDKEDVDHPMPTPGVGLPI